jgi:fructan beta-fructosidase
MHDAKGPVRPEIHFSPAASWLNDPNGLIFHDSLWHLYYQTNPLGLTLGNISWGHATSPDLVQWTEHETAISFDDTEAIFSGSMVCDRSGAAGFGSGALVAIYTSHRGNPQVGVHEAQSLAWSTDGGYTFHKYIGNPVLDRHSSDFRDPKVFRHEGRWIMVAVEAVENAVVMYGSDNLRDWELLSEFRHPDAAAPTWECPDLFPLVDAQGDTCWVLILSVNPEALTGGSGTRYFLGDFDGRTFTPFAGEGQQGWLDQGRDYYAAVSFADAPDGRRLMIGWMNNWEYARGLPPEPWAMQMAFPREVKLVGVGAARRLVQFPVPLPTVPQSEGFAFEGPLTGELALPGEAPAVIDISLEGLGAASIELALGVTFHWDRDTLTIRPRGGVAEPPAGFDREVVIPLSSDTQDFHVIVDHCSVEIFIDGGLRVVTHLCPPGLANAPWSLRCVSGSALVRVSVLAVHEPSLAVSARA